MEKYVINGGKPLYGEVEIAGAKNSALGIIVAAIMTDDEVVIENVPVVSDTKTLLDALKDIGATVKYLKTTGSFTVSICGKGINPDKPVDGMAIRQMRASYYILGALLGKYHRATVALPGGCSIGKRPMDLHVHGFRKLGAIVKFRPSFKEGDRVVVCAPSGLVGSEINYEVVSVGATINVMMAAVLAKGRTTIINAAKEPHVVDIANLLISMGANIRGVGYDTSNEIVIKGVERLHRPLNKLHPDKELHHSVIPDQIEAGTFMTMIAATGGNIRIKNVIPKHLECITSILREMGAKVIELDDSVCVIVEKRLKTTNVKTLPYPGFPTDMQPQMATALCLAEGSCEVLETIFENRFVYAKELRQMGADIQVYNNNMGKMTLENGFGKQNHTLSFFLSPQSINKDVKQLAHITGVSALRARIMNAPDLRGGAALVIAALAAEGKSEIKNIQFIKRGYEQFDAKIRALGGDIEMVEY